MKQHPRRCIFLFVAPIVFLMINLLSPRAAVGGVDSTLTIRNETLGDS
jgi:hypothetical protein